MADSVTGQLILFITIIMMKLEENKLGNNIQETMEKLENIANELYNGNINIGMAEMNLVLGDISFFATNMPEEKRSSLINDALTPLLESMENKDAVGMADIISYELITSLKE